jgi:hypothetical protein
LTTRVVCLLNTAISQDHGDATRVGPRGAGGVQQQITAGGGIVHVRLRQVLLPDTGRHRSVPHQLPHRAHVAPDAVALLTDVSVHRLWRRDYVAAVDAMVTLSSLSFTAGIDGYRTSA